MSEGIPYGDIIVIGAVALFIILRYRSILGQKTGHDFSNKPADNRGQNKVVSLHDGEVMDATAIMPEPDLSLVEVKDPQLVTNIANMKAIDPTFTLDGFISGARGAFEMVITAFSSHDRATLKQLLGPDVYSEFDENIRKQEETERKLHTTLVSLKEAEIKEAELKKTTARMTVQFLSEQITIERDKAGEIIGGDASDIQEIVDEWVFERDLKSRNPNWQIIET